MSKQLLRVAQRRAVQVGVGAALLAAGVGVGAAAVTSPDVGEVSDVSDVTPDTTTPETAQAPETTSESAPPAATTTDAPPVVEQSAPPATVDPVTTEEQPAVAPEVVDPESIGSTGEDGYYTPAPPRQNPGEPPLGTIERPPPVAPMPGEPGYVEPAG